MMPRGECKPGCAWMSEHESEWQQQKQEAVHMYEQSSEASC